MAAGLTASVPGRARASPQAARRIAALAAVLGSAILVAACATAQRSPTYPPAGVTPPPTAGRTDAARATVIGALTSAGLPAGDPDQPFRPPEGPWFAAAPRTVVQVSVPTETSPRFIVLYAFDTAADAAAAAADQATYISRGPGKVYFPSDSRFTIRTLGSVVVFFSFSPGNAADRAAEIETALGGVGTPVAIPG
jgi:hypothetical protein